MKKFMAEFKKFALRGNVIDMAVGVIIGGAFTGVVNSVSNNFIKPLLSFVTSMGANWGFMADGTTPWAISMAWADFLTTVINFVITAFVLFVIIHAMNKLSKLGKKPEAPKVPTTRKCPYCLSEIPIEATKCAHCTSELPPVEA